MKKLQIIVGLFLFIFEILIKRLVLEILFCLIQLSLLLQVVRGVAR